MAGERAIRRVLVANRGEIARRLIRGVHDDGCEAVAVFAADDAGSPHVGEADAAVLLPGTSIGQTYLDPAALVHAADRTGADALHPGYGFLSEDPALAEACVAAGIAWVGPPPAAMRAMGHKARAKELVAAAGLPVLPSAELEGASDADALAALAGGVGYPLLVKASAGGGGRGMRLVRGRAELADAVASARREAGAAFGSDDVFVERYLEAPRHVEVQVIADRHATVLHLFDRECSVQRRHQKIVEEAPAAFVADEVRRAMWSAAVDAARAVGYESAGTVEFLVDGDRFYFLEMNTRLQVEHGVTELVTGLDLVGLQLGVAAGRRLPITQEEVAVRGHAIEVRLCAERPREGYRPTPGTVTHVRWPEGPAVRIDRAVESGSTVSSSYDSLVAKVMASGEDRAHALGRLARTLRSLELDGLETNRDLLQAVLDDAAFVRGEVDVHFLERRAELAEATPADVTRRRHGAAVGSVLLSERAARSLVPVPAASWRNVGQALHADQLTDAGGTIEVRATAPGGAVHVAAGGVWEEVGTACSRGAVVDLTSADGVRRRYAVRLSPHRAEVNGPEGQCGFALRAEDDPDERGGIAGECRAPLPGAVTKILVAEGDRVEEGAGLVVLEAMKMEHTLRAHGSGTVTSVACVTGQQVDVHDLLVTVEPGP